MYHHTLLVYTQTVQQNEQAAEKPLITQAKQNDRQDGADKSCSTSDGQRHNGLYNATSKHTLTNTPEPAKVNTMSH
jgi:hypothetical protein